MSKLPTDNDEKTSVQEKNNPSEPISTEHSIPNTSKENNAIANSGKNKVHHEKQINWPSWITAVCTVLIVIITGFYTYYASEQVAQMKEAVRITGGQFRKDQRAWMVVSDVKTIFVVGKPVELTISFKNTGKTAAKTDAIVIVSEILQGETYPNYTKESSKLTELTDQSKGIIPSLHGVSSTINATGEPLSETLYKDVITDKIRIYIHGIFKYDDIFGKHHWTTFCLFISKDGNSCSIYKEHNDTDND